MLALNDLQAGYPFCPVRNLKLNAAIERMSSFCESQIFFFEGDPHTSKLLLQAKKAISKEIKLVKIEFEEPNRFFLMNSISELNYHRDYMSTVFDAVFSICPYTTSAESSCALARYPTFFPYPTEDVLTQRNQRPRIHNLIYTGHLFDSRLLDIAQIVREYNGIVVSGSQTGLETHRNVSYQSKLDLYRSSKLAIIHNELFPSQYHSSRIANLSSDHRVASNKAFDDLFNAFHTGEPNLATVPQLKSRTFEAAFNKCMMLVSADNHKIAARYFSEYDDFIYFHSNDDLREKINYYLLNSDERNYIAANAYSRAVNSYTTDHFIRNALKLVGVSTGATLCEV